MSYATVHRASAQPRHGLVPLSQPAALPLTLAQTKAFLRVDFPDDDALIRAQIAAAARYLGETRGVTFITTNWRQTLDVFPYGAAILLPRHPYQQVSQIEYTDASGGTVVLPPGKYVVGSGLAPVRVHPAPGKSWPATQAGAIEAVRVDFTAGYGLLPGDVPDDAREALLQAVAILYGCRTVSIGDPDVMAALGAVGQSVWSEWMW